MKNILRILFIQILALCLVCTVVRAESDPCKITMSSSKKTLAPGDEITLNITMSNVTVEGGAKFFLGLMDYDDDVFEVIYDDSDDALDEVASFTNVTGYDEDSVAALYLGSEDTAISNNTWTAMAVCDDDYKMSGIVAYSAAGEKDTQIIAKIKLKVNEDAEEGTSQITLEQMQISDDGENEFNISKSSTITYTISENGTSSGTGSTGSGSSSAGSTGSGTSTNNKTNNTAANSSSQGKTPYTGLDDYIFVISVILLIGFVSLIKYIKYKDINIDE